MKVDINNIHITEELICAFVDGKTTQEEDRLIYARMSIDKQFANEVQDLMEAMEAISEIERQEVDLFESSQVAAAAFSSEIINRDMNSTDFVVSASMSESSDDLADDFLNALGDDEPNDIK